MSEKDKKIQKSKKTNTKSNKTDNSNSVPENIPEKDEYWKFKKGNTIGMETRFKPGHKFSTKYSSEYIDSMYNYFSDSNNIFPTLEGFAVSAGISIRTLERWVHGEKKYPQMAITYAQCKAIQKEKLLLGGLTRAFDAQLVKFIAVNNHGMKEKVEQEVKGDAQFKVNISFFDDSEEESKDSEA